MAHGTRLLPGLGLPRLGRREGDPQWGEAWGREGVWARSVGTYGTLLLLERLLTSQGKIRVLHFYHLTISSCESLWAYLHVNLHYIL